LIMIEASPSADHGGRLALGTATHESGGDLRRLYTPPPQFYGGID
jgi:hypothetical protein